MIEKRSKKQRAADIQAALVALRDAEDELRDASKANLVKRAEAYVEALAAREQAITEPIEVPTEPVE